MSDRMLSDEILLGIINSKSGGGGGGTTNYNNLDNLPQIGGVTLQGNKTASDLGLVAEEADKGLSSNDYTNADKAIVGGVTAALAGKQGALTAGNNIKLDNDTISVNRWAIPAGKVVYTVITSDENYGQNVHVQRHTTSGGFIDDRVYLVQSWQTKTVDDVISIEDQYAKYKITLLKDSDEQSAGYYYMVNPTTTPTSNSFTFVMPQEENDNDLIIREELDAVSDAVDAIKDGANIESFADVESALAGKQDKTDNALQTTDKTVVGAVNELKSGLTNVADDVKLNTQDLTTPSRTKNLIPTTLDILKTANTSGTWSGNAYTAGEVTYTVNTDSDGHVTSIDYSNSSTVSDNQLLIIPMPKDGNNYLFNGGISGDCFIFIWDKTTNARAKKWDGTSNSDNATSSAFKEVKNVANHDLQMLLRVTSGVTAGSGTFYPMLCKSTIIDPTFTPYIPSVDARLDAVESGLANCVKTVKLNIGSSGATQSIPLDKSKIYDIEVSVANNASVYNYYHWFAMYGQSSWITAEISKVEQSTTNVALTYTIDSSNNLVVTNSGNWGATGVIKIATVDK